VIKKRKIFLILSKYNQFMEVSSCCKTRKYLYGPFMVFLNKYVVNNTSLNTVAKNCAPYWLDLNNNYLNASSCIHFIIFASQAPYF
jgi:hypothetical protein